MIIIKSRFLTTGEVWFDDEPTDEKVDVMLFRQRSSPIAGTQCSPFHTILINLTQEADDVLASFEKDTRYEIRRAATKDSFVCRHWDKETSNVLSQFIGFYNQFAKTKGLGEANQNMLMALCKADVLALSSCRSSTQEDLVWHIYYRCPTRVRLLHSASLFRETSSGAYRSMVGRANRFLHWQDMLHFKSEGVTVYDMGGWYEGKSDEEKLRINKFKEEFGGTVVKEFNCEKLLTWKARIVNIAGKLLKR